MFNPHVAGIMWAGCSRLTVRGFAVTVPSAAYGTIHLDKQHRSREWAGDGGY
jgi:hypothetical protein